jgi:hypothetical protein
MEDFMAAPGLFFLGQGDSLGHGLLLETKWMI